MQKMKDRLKAAGVNRIIPGITDYEKKDAVAYDSEEELPEEQEMPVIQKPKEQEMPDVQEPKEPAHVPKIA